jgi:hypothetical protein
VATFISILDQMQTQVQDFRKQGDKKALAVKVANYVELVFNFVFIKDIFKTCRKFLKG